jgi:hypothetical protein
MGDAAFIGEAKILWGRAEQEGVDEGTALADAALAKGQVDPSPKFVVDAFVTLGNDYRSLVESGGGPDPQSYWETWVLVTEALGQAQDFENKPLPPLLPPIP